MDRRNRIAILAMIALLLPFSSVAQGLAGEIKGLQGVLDQLYDEMIGMSANLIGVGRSIAGLAALFYIAYRVWRHIANAEPIDFYPLMRPFALGFCIMIFPSVIGLINGIMKPTVTGTAAMVEGSDLAIERLLKEKEKVLKDSDFWKMYVGENGEGDRDQWYRYTHEGQDPADEGMFAVVGNDIKFAMSKAYYNFSNSVKEWMAQVLQVLFQAAALCINTLRTFQLIVLAILGPLVFGLAIFDGFQYSLSMWLARYINVFLWLPVANIFGAIIGKVQEKMIALDIGQIQQTGDTFFSSKDAAYLVFLLIGIVGYFTVPTVAGYIINAGGGGALGHKVSRLFGGAAGSVGSAAAGTAGAVLNSPASFHQGLAGQDGTGFSGQAGSTLGYGGAFLADKVSGKKNDSEFEKNT